MVQKMLSTMPGLPKTPRALDIDKDNKILGLS